MQIMITLAYNTIQRLCTKSEVIWTNENRVIGQKSWLIFYYVIWENGLVGIHLHTNMAAEIQGVPKKVTEF